LKTKFIRDALQLLLSVTLILFAVFLTKAHDNAFLIGLAVLAALVSLFVLFIFRSRKKHKANQSAAQQELEHFLRTAERVPVNFEDCEIKMGYEKIVDDGEIPLVGNSLGSSNMHVNMAFAVTMYSLAGEESAPAVDKDVESCRIVFKTSLRGKMRTFYSPLIRKDKTTLEFLLASKKETLLFVDRGNAEKYWMDLGFLF